MSNDLRRRQPRRIMARTIALSGTALLGAALLAWTPQPATGWDQSAAEATLWQLLNGDRTNNGLPPLAKHSTLVSLARWRSKDMVDRDYFSHTILGTNYQVYHWYDTSGLSWSSGGENIGYNNGYSDADSPIKINEGFMASAGHRANILNPDWSHGGVGAYGKDGVMWGGKIRNIRMYTELFIKLKSTSTATPKPVATPAPTPKPAGASSITFAIKGGGDASVDACGAMHHYRTYAVGSQVRFAGTVRPIPSGRWKVKLKIKVCAGGSFAPYAKFDALRDKHRGTFSGSFAAPPAGLYSVRAVLYINGSSSGDSLKHHVQTH